MCVIMGNVKDEDDGEEVMGVREEGHGEWNVSNGLGWNVAWRARAVIWVVL